MRTNMAACERVTISASMLISFVFFMQQLPVTDTEMTLFWLVFGIENCIPRPFSATTRRTKSLNACHNTTQPALSTHPYKIASSPSIHDFDEKHKNRLTSPRRGETRLNSCVCEVHEGRYSTDNSSASRACCVQLIERGLLPKRTGLLSGLEHTNAGNAISHRVLNADYNGAVFMNG